MIGRMTGHAAAGPPGDHHEGGPAACELLIRGRRGVTPAGLRAAAVGIAGGQVSAIEPAAGPAAAELARQSARVVDLAADEVLLPGLVDAHVHVNEPGRTEWEGFASATRAAVGGQQYAGFLRSRPDAAETAAIARVIDLARRYRARLHILHLSSAAAVPMLAAARRDGLAITVETCPHYLALAAEGIPAGATPFKCCPPIRGQANRELLWEALRAGIIDCVVSDHSPCPPGLKRLADEEMPPPGAASPRSRSRCPWSGPGRGRAGTRWPRSRAGWRPGPPRSPGWRARGRSRPVMTLTSSPSPRTTASS